MRYGLILAATLLSGCYAPQDAGYGSYAQPGYPTASPDYGYAQPAYGQPSYTQPGYSQPGYSQPGYSPPGYGQPGEPPGYEAAPYDPTAAAYPGYDYSGGAPTYLDAGAPVPLVLLGGQWGYYDSGRHWHHAPEGVSRHLEEQRGAGRWADHPVGPPHHEERPGPPGGRFHGPAQFRPPEPARPPAIQAAAPHPPAPPPQPARQEPHERPRTCPPGQRC